MKTEHVKKTKKEIEQETLNFCRERKGKGGFFSATEEAFLQHDAKSKEGFLNRIFYDDERSEKEPLSKYQKEAFKIQLDTKLNYIKSGEHLRQNNNYEQSAMKPYGVKENESNKGFWWCVLGIVFLALLIKFL